MHFSIERETMTRQRINEILDLIWVCKDLHEFSVDITVSNKNDDHIIHVFTKVPEHGIGSTFYYNRDYCVNTGDHDGIRTIIDKDFKKAESHIRRLIDGYVLQRESLS